MKDHDLLLRLTQKVDDFETSINAKVDDLKADIKDIKDGVSVRLAKVEADIKRIDEFHASINAPEELGAFHKYLKRTDSLENKWRIAVALMAPIYLGVIGFILDRFFNIFR